MTIVYEYAGFRYTLHLDNAHRAENAVPLPDQHAAASKDRHRRAACEQYNDEQRSKR